MNRVEFKKYIETIGFEYNKKYNKYYYKEFRIELFKDNMKPEISDDVFNAINEFFSKDDLYIVCTKSENIKENIPMNMYQVDYNDIDVSQTGIKIDNLVSNYFNKNKDFYLEKLVKININYPLINYSL